MHDNDIDLYFAIGWFLLAIALVFYLMIWG
jgi:hypothetical protein